MIKKKKRLFQKAFEMTVTTNKERERKLVYGFREVLVVGWLHACKTEKLFACIIEASCAFVWCSTLARTL